MTEMHTGFWAKATLDNVGLNYKSVAHHLLDVAATAVRFLENNPSRLKREAMLTGLPVGVHGRLCSLLAALHDLGKISVVFQSQRADLWPAAVLGPWPEKVIRRYGHWEATGVLLNATEVKAALAPVFGPGGIPEPLISAIAGHHGRAPDGDYAGALAYKARQDREIGPHCAGIAAELCQELVCLFPELRGLPPPSNPVVFSFALNGLITLADWVGSDLEYFPCVDPMMKIEDYWPLALAAADRALADKELIPARARAASLGELSAHAGPARPMQALAASLAIPAEPQIVVIEDGTGSGKTEAALLLASRMMAAGLGEGLFVALPTMATANAMHGRLDTAMSGLFDGDASLVLAHGKSALANALSQLGAARGDDDEGSVANHFNAWIGDSRKKAFFADAGAGTIDQAFLAILPKKHLTMRQYALAGRILVIDEAHACDAYMGEELLRLVKMQAGLGGSVIVLSATLKGTFRHALVQSFRDGREEGALPLPGTARPSYPLLTRWSKSTGLEEHAVDPSPDLARSVTILPLASRAEGISRALEAAGKGAAVIMICNTVDAAIESHDALLSAGHDPALCHLAHARFTVDDRLEIEGRIQEFFGRESRPETRAGRILAATQVIEQSLNFDADMMISDLAPADLVIQRAGRLWRHARPGRPVAEPVLHLLTAPPEDDVGAGWLDATLGSAVHVYKLPGVMWRTARMLLANGRLDTPDDLRRLVETAYMADEEDLPAALRPGHRESAGKDYAAKSRGRLNVINPWDGYGVLTGLSSDEEIGTRLGEKQVTLRLARREGTRLAPIVRREGADDRLNWPLSEVSVRAGWLKHHTGKDTPEPADPALVERTRSVWPEWERDILLFEVAADGTLMTAKSVGLVYDGKRGLRVDKQVDI